MIELINPLSSPSPLSSFTISQIEWNNPKSPGNGEAVIFFCGDHDGYTMRVGYKNGKKNGAASLCYPDGIVYMNAHFVDDVQKGEYRIRNEDGNIIEEGCLRNGKRHGMCKGPTGKGRPYYEGYVLEPSESLPWCWEMKENDELVRVAQVNFDSFLMDGICYEYEEGVLKMECLYEKDVLKRIIREWDGDVMTEYNEKGEKEYEGGYEDSPKNEKRRKGYGKVFANNTIAYEGCWEEGKMIWADVYHDGVVGEHLTMNDEMSGYWDVKDEKGDLVSTSQYNSVYLEKEGVSYEYMNGELIEKSMYHGGKKELVLAEWKGEKMIEYQDNGKRSYEGGWKGDVLSGFVREGRGNEYGLDGSSVVYKGDWLNGRRHGNGTWYKNGNGLPTFSGEWKNGYPNGSGCLKDETGADLYRGYWENGYKNEYWYTWIDYEDGKKYQSGDKRRLRNWVLRGGEEPPSMVSALCYKLWGYLVYPQMD